MPRKQKQVKNVTKITTVPTKSRTRQPRSSGISKTSLAATQRQKVNTRRGATNNTIISGSEIVNSVPFKLEEDGSVVFSLIPANPCYWTGTNISQQASQYTAYRPIRFGYTYIPQVSVNHDGIVQVGTLWCTSVSSTALSQTLQTSPGGCMSQVWSRFSKNVPLSGLQQSKFNTNGELAQSTNPFMLVAYNRGATQLDDSGQYILPGTLIIHYTYKLFNKIGSGAVFGRINSFSWGSDLDRSHANMSFVVRKGSLPPVTILDIDDGVLKYNGSTLNPTVSATLVGDVYWNDPAVTSTSSIIVGEDLTIQYLTDIQYTNDLSEPWVTVDTYYGPMGFDITYGLPGYITVFVTKNKLLTQDNREKYSLGINAWVGSKKFDPTANSVFSGGYFCQLPFNSDIYIRGVSNLGKHTNVLYFSHTWTSALTLQTDPPAFNVCPPWAGAKLEDHHTVEPEDDAPNEENTPEGIPELSPDDADPIDATYAPEFWIRPQTSSILSPGLYWAIWYDGRLPFPCESFTVDQETLYNPTILDPHIYILNEDQFKTTWRPPGGKCTITGVFPMFTSDNYTTPTDYQALFFKTSENYKDYKLVPDESSGNIHLVEYDADDDEDLLLNLMSLPEPPEPFTIFAGYDGKLLRFGQVTVTPGDPDSEGNPTPGTYNDIPGPFNVVVDVAKYGHGLPDPIKGFYHPDYLQTP